MSTATVDEAATVVRRATLEYVAQTLRMTADQLEKLAEARDMEAGVLPVDAVNSVDALRTELDVLKVSGAVA